MTMMAISVDSPVFLCVFQTPLVWTERLQHGAQFFRQSPVSNIFPR